MLIGYVNARVRGMRSRLFDRKMYETLLHKPDIDTFIAELEKTPYKEDIEKASVRADGIHNVEEALRFNLARIYRLILDMAHDEPFEPHIRVILNRWDVQNIKTILRGKNVHVPAEEVLECLIPAGELDDVTLVEMVKQPDIKAVIDLLATWKYPYARVLTQHFSRYAKRRNLAVLEYALDKYYYEYALDAIRGRNYNDQLVRDILSTEIDTINLKTIFRLIRDKIGVEEGKNAFIPGGKIIEIETLLQLLASQNCRKVLDYLEGTPYDFLPEHHPISTNGVNVSVLEKDLDRFLIGKGIRLFRGDPLSIAVVIGYIWAKDTEVKNIRIIARGKSAYLPEEELLEDLVYV
jgi:V/A-type H+-transporting ATPase subunit C